MINPLDRPVINTNFDLLTLGIQSREQQQQHFIHSCTAYIHLNKEKELN